MTPESAADFFVLAHRHWPPGSVFRVFCRNPKTAQIFGTGLEAATELEMVCHWAEKHGYDCYWQPNSTTKKDGTRCKTHDITAWCFFLIDIDPIETSARPSVALLEVQRRLMEMLQVSLDGYWCESGRGIQAWYPLAPTPTHSLVNAPRAQSYWLGRLSSEMGHFAGCTLDPSSADLPRVMRLPNTINTKTGRRTRLTRLARGANPLLAQRLLERTPAHIFDIKEPKKSVDMGPWQAYLPLMTVGGRKFLTEGAAEGARHKAATAAMLSLCELGASRSEVLSALLYGAQFCDPPLHSHEVEDMVRRRSW